MEGGLRIPRFCGLTEQKLCEMRMKGGIGPKIPKFTRTSLRYRPYALLWFSKMTGELLCPHLIVSSPHPGHVAVPCNQRDEAPRSL